WRDPRQGNDVAGVGHRPRAGAGEPPMSARLPLFALALAALGFASPTLAAKIERSRWQDPDVVPGTILVQLAPGAAAIARGGGRVTAAASTVTFDWLEAPVRARWLATRTGTTTTTSFHELLPNAFVGTFDPARTEQVLAELEADPAV